MDAILMPNLDTARAFLRTLDSTGVFSFATFPDSGDEPHLRRRFHGPLDAALIAELVALNSSNAGVFVTVNELDGRGYCATNVTRVRAVFVDLDGADVEPVLGWSLKPHMVVESSPGKWHAYWLVEGLPTAAFIGVQVALAHLFGGDPKVCDLPRVMRLPGFYHRKGTSVQVALNTVEAEFPPYTVEQVRAALDLGADGPSIAAAEESSIGEGGRNDSLTRVAGRLRRSGLSGTELANELHRTNRERCRPPLPEGEVERIAASVARYPVPASTPTGLATTDTGNAQRFVAKHGQNVKYVPELGKWIIWRGDYWTVDAAGSVIELAKDTAKTFFGEVAACDSDSVRSMLAKHASQSLNRARLQAMISLAATDREVVVHVDQLDADPWLLGTQNGVIDLRTGSFRASRRDDLLTQRCGAVFDGAAKCPTFMAFLERVTGGDSDLITYLQRLVGYILSGSTEEQCFAFLYGHGANGKSTFLDLIARLCGDYGTQTQPETLMARRGGGASSDLARLMGKRLVVSNEVREGAHLEENLIKQLVGGDVVTARFLYQEHFEFRPRFKLLIAGNHQPVIKGDDDGIWRRVHLVPFVQTIPVAERDKKLGEKLGRELPGILNWAIEGCLAWQKSGMGVPAVITEATKRYRKEMDLMGAWIEEQCEQVVGVRSKSRLLYASYRQWAEAGCIKPVSNMVFLRKLDTRGFRREHTRDGNVLVGIALRGGGLAMVA